MSITYFPNSSLQSNLQTAIIFNFNSEIPISMALPEIEK